MQVFPLESLAIHISAPIGHQSNWNHAGAVDHETQSEDQLLLEGQVYVDCQGVRVGPLVVDVGSLDDVHASYLKHEVGYQGSEVKSLNGLNEKKLENEVEVNARGIILFFVHVVKGGSKIEYQVGLFERKRRIGFGLS